MAVEDCNPDRYEPSGKSLSPSGSEDECKEEGDTLTAAVMQKFGLTLESYALNHLAGSIGRKLLLTVRDVMRTGNDLPRIPIGSKLHEGVLELMRSGAGCVLVTQEMFLKGVLTDGDLRRHIADNTFDLHGPIEKYTTTKPLYLEDESMKLMDAQQLFHSGSRSVSCLPVVRKHIAGSEVVGLLVLSDTMKALA